jgi:hypothetical protein
MTDKPPDKPRPAMIGLPPSARGGRPADIAEHAAQSAMEWQDVIEAHVAVRNEELGIPDRMNGQPNYGGDGRWQVFNPLGRQGGENTTGVVLDSGVLNFDLLKGEKGGKLWANARLRDRIDAAISHEYEELLANGNQAKAIKNAAKTKLPISDMAKRINRARAR